MFNNLRKIVQEVNAADDLAQALPIMVRCVREAINTQASAIYLLDKYSADFVLMATDGLNPDAVGKIRIPRNKGIIGLVVQREEPINLEDAPSHPQYFSTPTVGEEKFQAFLGVPITHRRRVFGVLTVQEEEKRCYDEEEEAFLVTLAAQLSGVIAHAEATGELTKLTARSNLNYSPTINGVACVPGVGIGHAVVVYPVADLDAVPDREATNIDEEINLLYTALAAARADMQWFSQKLNALPPEEHALFDVYLRLLDDNSLGTEVSNEIQTSGLWAQAALRRVIKKHAGYFEAMTDEYLQERAGDFKDLGLRVLAHLQTQQTTIKEYPAEVILVSEELTASALAEVPQGQLRGIISVKGSKNSHVAILARALGVPTVMGISGLDVNEISDEQLIVDGYSGQVHRSPSKTTLAEFKRLVQEEEALTQSLQELRDEPTETLDGHRVQLFVNTGLAVDAGLSLSVGAEGVGLYRSEVPFMMRDRFPSGEEQRIIYHQLLKAFAPQPVIMRTLDIGGDKHLSYFPITEDNPFLGWRGVRITLDHPDVFLVQVRAMLQASKDLDNLSIMLPMISGIEELDAALKFIRQAYNEVNEEENGRITYPKLGVMIEIPSAVYQARELARRVDFLSVGSNDLIQYLLAVDRNNSRVASLYDSLHPAVLKALMQVADSARLEGKQLSICGEMANDPEAVILLLAMGFNSLSMSPSGLLRARWVIRSFTMTKAQALLNEVLSMENPVKIRHHLIQGLEQAELGGLIKAGRK